MADKYYADETVRRIFETGIDLTVFDTLELHVMFPSGSAQVFTLSAVDGELTQCEKTFAYGDLSEAGTYRAHVVGWKNKIEAGGVVTNAESYKLSNVFVFTLLEKYR